MLCIQVPKGKSLQTSIRIGKHLQPVIYEGIS